MRKYKPLLWIIVIILFSSFVNAALDDGLVSYYSFDVNADDDVNGNDGVVTGAIHNTTFFKLGGGSYDFDGNNDLINVSDAVNLDMTTGVTVSFWAYLEAYPIGGEFPNYVGKCGDADDVVSYGIRYAGTADNNQGIYDIGGTIGVNGNKLALNKWNYLTTIYNTTHIVIYENSSLIAVSAAVAGITASSGDLVMGIDCSIGGASYMNAFIDEVGIWNRSLTLTEIQQLGTGLNPVPAATNTTITATDEYNGSAITTFTATIFNSTFSTELNTSTGTITTNLTGIFNVTFNATDYFNSTLTNGNFSPTNALTNTMYQSVLNVFVKDIVSNTTVNSFTANLSLIGNTTAVGLITFHTNAGSLVLNTTAPSYSSNTTTVTTTALGITNVTIFLVPFINITLLEETTGDPFNVNETDSTTLFIFCPAETIEYEFNQTSNEYTTLIGVNCPWTLFKLDVTYATNGSYFRTLIPELTDQEVTFYTIDLLTETAVQIIMNLDDLTGEFIDGIATIRKVIGTETVNIIQQGWDIETTINLYLIRDQVYTLVLTDVNGNERSIGGFIADSAGEKTITVPTIPFLPDSEIGEIIQWAWNDEGFDGTLIRLQYNDSSTAQTNYINFTVFNGTDLTQLYTDSTTNAGVVTFSYISTVNESYLACFEAIKTGIEDLKECNVFYTSEAVGNFSGFTTAQQETMTNWFFAILFVLIILGFRNRVSIGMGLNTFFMIVFIRWGWFTLGSTTKNIMALSLMGLLTVIIYFIESDKI